MEKNNISKLPEGILEEILVRVPVESMVKCICVCENWNSIIRQNHFKDSYWDRSMTRPRLLFEYSRRPSFPKPSNKLFQSVYQQEEPLLSSGLKQMLISSAPEYRMFSAPQRGLVCLGSENKFVLCNPGTNKVKALPECKRLRPVGESKINCFFGYDDVTQAFKFLVSENNARFTSKYSHKPLMPHQVFTIKIDELEIIKEKSWRVTECQHKHVPVTKSLSLNGFFYYGAKSLVEVDKYMIISFDLGWSDQFTRIDLPEGVELIVGHEFTLVNYNGEVGLVKDLWSVMDNGTRVYEIYVRDENARKWRKEPVVIPCLGDTVGDDMRFCCQGSTIGTTGELVFATESVGEEGSHLVLYYDTSTRSLRMFKIQGVDGSSYFRARTFVNHYDSLLLT